MSRHIAVIGDRTISYPIELTLSINPNWGLTPLHFETISDFIDEDVEPAAVIMTDLTSDDSRTMLNCVATLVCSRVPVVVVAYHPETRDTVLDAWGKIEEHAKATNDRVIQGMLERGETIDPEMKKNPADTTPVIIVNRESGAGGVLQTIADVLEIPRDELASLPDVAFVPLPEPMTSVGSLVGGGSKKGRMYAFTSDKGGCGKTTTAILFGAAIAYHSITQKKPLSVVIVDADRQSQLRSHFRSIPEGAGIVKLKTGATKDEIHAAAIPFEDSQGRPFPGLHALVGGSNRSEHLAFRDSGIYSDFVPTLREMFDVVIVDCSVGINSDEVTKWLQQNSEITYYVLDQSRESFDMAVEARNAAVDDTENGGLGIARDQFRILVNRLRHGPSSDLGAEWAALLDTAFSSEGTPVEAEIPESHPEVSDSKDLRGLVELVQTSENLAPALQELAHKAFPTIIPKPSASIGGKKRRPWR